LQTARPTLPGGRPAYEGLSQDDLARLAQQGDGEAFRRIVQHGNQRLFRIARAVVGDDSEAEDVVQETYVKAYAKLDTFRAEANIHTWLTSIALNEARGRLRQRRNTVDIDQIEAAQTRDSQVIPFPMNEDSETPEANAARLQIRHLIEAAVDSLPPLFRIVFIMRDIEDYSIEETASLLDMKAETVKTRLHRARRLLRTALDEKIGMSLKGAFPFLGARCQRLTDAVTERLNLLPHS
jgi:RNA polymerase sigma-70 factor (ECF subfamily)